MSLPVRFDAHDDPLRGVRSEAERRAKGQLPSPWFEVGLNMAAVAAKTPVSMIPIIGHHVGLPIAAGQAAMSLRFERDRSLALGVFLTKNRLREEELASMAAGLFAGVKQGPRSAAQLLAPEIGGLVRLQSAQEPPVRTAADYETTNRSGAPGIQVTSGRPGTWDAARRSDPDQSEPARHTAVAGAVAVGRIEALNELLSAPRPNRTSARQWTGAGADDAVTRQARSEADSEQPPLLSLQNARAMDRGLALTAVGDALRGASTASAGMSAYFFRESQKQVWEKEGQILQTSRGSIGAAAWIAHTAIGIDSAVRQDIQGLSDAFGRDLSREIDDHLRERSHAESGRPSFRTHWETRRTASPSGWRDWSSGARGGQQSSQARGPRLQPGPASDARLEHHQRRQPPLRPAGPHHGLHP